MNETVNFQAEMSPFGWEPSHASRIEGLGGGYPAPEGAYAFKTAPLIVPAGKISVVVAFERLTASRGTLLIEIIAGQGSERRQLQLRTAPLCELVEAGGIEVIELITDRREAYAVAGYVYDDTDAAAQSVSVRITVTAPTAEKRDAIGRRTMIRAARLAGLELPSFVHPTSQTWSRGQMSEGEFRSVCQAVGLEIGPASWPIAYVYQAIKYLIGDLSGLTGFGAGISADIVARAFRAEGAEIVGDPGLDPAYWPPADDLDLAWLIFEVPKIEVGHLFWMANLLLDRLKPGGALVLVFTFEHGRMAHEPCDVLNRGDVETMAIRLLAQGHSVAQLRFRAANRPFPTGTRTAFGLMVRRAS